MKISNLTKFYAQTKILDNVSLEIPHGKITSFIGPNGAGKSTLMHIISRLIKGDSGSVSFKGKELKEWKSKELAKHLAILTQSHQTNMKLSVRELVAFGRFPYSGARLTADDWEKVNEAMKIMELGEIADKFIDELSGGQRQRAFIAMVIAQDTDYVLFDEPTNNLDIYHSVSLMKNIKFLSQNLGKTVILVMHELNLAAFYSDYICAFKEGRILKFGQTHEIMQKEILREIYGVEFEIMDIKGKPLSICYE